MSAPVLHFEIQAENVDRCMAFYRDVFGWEIVDVPGMEQVYWMVYPNGEAPPDGMYAGPGIAGGMLVRPGPAAQVGAPVNGFVCILQVDDLDATYAKVQASGVTIALEPMDIPGVGRVFYSHDTENNIFGVLEPAPGQAA